MSTIRPLNDYVVVRREKTETKSKGGLILPTGAQEAPVVGEVIAVGPGKTKNDGTVQEMVVKVGDKVLFNKHAGTEAVLNEEKILMMHEEEIVGVL